MNQPLIPYPTFGEFKKILIHQFRCNIEPPIPNLAYSPRPVTTFKRTVGGDQVEWQTTLRDDERLTREVTLSACRNLRTYPPKLNFLPDADPVP